MDKSIKSIQGTRWKIKSIQRFGYIIECIDNKKDVRWITVKGWNLLNEAIS